MPKRRLYDQDLRKTVSDTTTEYVEGRPVPSGLVLYVVHAVLEDETSSPNTMSFGKRSGDRFEALEEALDPVAGLRYETDKTHHFIEGESPVWRVEGATSGDILSGHLEGYFEEA